MIIQPVSGLTARIKALIDSDRGLKDVWVRGEVSNFSRPVSGHWYLTLKDEHSQLTCLMWRTRVMFQDYTPRDGDAVIAHGRVSVYAAAGRYQFVADLIQPEGLGDLHAAFGVLKARLAAEGLFDAAHKLSLPLRPRRIGVVTSPGAAVLRDICSILARRYPLVEVILSPCPVQGDGAASEIALALRRVATCRPDVIILTRGGGSIEELWAFNEEEVARAIYECSVPVVSAVGHETDFTIADFVADVRAATASAAVEAVVPDRRELQAGVFSNLQRMALATTMGLERAAHSLTLAIARLERASPQHALEARRLETQSQTARLVNTMRQRLRLESERVASRRAQLETLGPASTLARGYAHVSHAVSGATVTSPRHVRPGDGLRVRVSEGVFGATAGRQRSFGRVDGAGDLLSRSSGTNSQVASGSDLTAEA
jgi:exodeoxyribonuclease VII large subunit